MPGSSSPPETQLVLPPADPNAPAQGYTIRDTPDVQERVDDDLAQVVGAVRGADPHLRALVLTGGFARGEGAVLHGQPQNDYDFVAIRDSALRGRGAYEPMRLALERELGLHIDLRPVWVGRVARVRPTIFWYETGQRGRVLWGDTHVLQRIPVRRAAQLHPAEGLRLLVNRAAGLLLSEPEPDEHLHRIQASKGFLAALDAHLLSLGLYAPSQRERWAFFEDLLDRRAAPPELVERAAWLAWAFRFKVDPANAPPRDARQAWEEAGRAILGAVPVALGHAGLDSVAHYAARDGWLDNAAYRLQAGRVPGARRWAAHPTGRVRVATLALLAERLGLPAEPPSRSALRKLVRDPPQGLAAVPLLAGLRGITSQ